MDDINEKVSFLVTKWREADSKRMIFGLTMPQTKNAMKDLFQSFQQIFDEILDISLIEKEKDIEAVVKVKEAGKKDLQKIHIPVNMPTMPKIFEQFKIKSFTLSSSLTEEDLVKFFEALSLLVEESEKQNGLKGFLQSQGVKSIKIDQMKFQLLKEDDDVSAGQGGPGGQGDSGGQGGLGPGGGGAGGERSAKASGQKMGKGAPSSDSIWKEFLKGDLKSENFQNQHHALIEAAQANPAQLTKAIKSMVSKQKGVEKFLANLEHKLFDLGFPPDAIESLKKKVSAPKKVLIAEDELARLREIERKLQGGIDERIEDSVEAVGRLKRKLSDERERSEAILHQTGQGGIVLDNQGNIVAANPVAQKILGLCGEKVQGKLIEDVVGSHHMVSMVSGWQNETDEQTPKGIKIQALNEQTADIIRESAIVVENEEGRAVGVISALQNVTQQNEFEERKNDVLDVLGHDLRAPICAIKQNFSMLVDSSNLSQNMDAQQEKFLNSCKRNIERIEKLIEKILDVRQFETGKILLKCDMIETNRLLEDAANSLKSWAQDKNINLEIRTEALPKIECDSERIYQVMTNLVANALKFTPKNGEVVVGGKGCTIDGEEGVEIWVKDSGMGIKKEDLPRIFKKYEQVSLRSPEGVSGLGLGLALCKVIVELHHGIIWAESGLGAGSTFSFQIPVLQANGEDS